MTQPAPTPSGSSTPPARGRARSPLRWPAVAVTVLAAAVVLTSVIEVALLLLQSRIEVAPYLIQVLYLIAIPVGLAFSAAVIWLLSASSLGGRRVSRLPLLALGLLVLSVLLSPVVLLLTTLLEQLGVGGDGVVGFEVRYTIATVLTNAATILLTVAIGVIALVLLLRRPQPDARTARLPLGPVPVAVVLLIGALLSTGIMALQFVLPGMLTSAGSNAQMTSFTLLTTVQGLLSALLLLTVGVLIALTAGWTRKVLWGGLGLYWLTKLLISVLVRISTFRVLSGAVGVASWLTPTYTALDVIGGLALAATAVVVIVLLRRRRAQPVQS